MRVLFRLLLIACTLSTGLLSEAALANWRIRKIVNNSNQPLTYAVPVATGTLADSSSLSSIRGDAIIILPGIGTIIMRDTGHNKSPCGRPYWGVQISFLDRKWGFFYDGGGVVDLTVGADGAVSFTAASGGSQVVNGDGPPQCRG